MLKIPRDYYLDSLNEVKICDYLYRTGGSAQIQSWGKELGKEFMGNIVKHRKYFKGIFRGKMVFVKQFIEPNLRNWTIKESIEYQFQNLLLLKDLKYVPQPLFLTDDVVGMEYIEGETIKNLVFQKRFDLELGKSVVQQLRERGAIIVSKLRSINRKYDCSYNNILVKKDGQITFVDFDYSPPLKSVDEMAQIIESLANGKLFFKRDGRLSGG